MSFLCEFIFGILIIELGLNLHGFNMEADNQSCNQNPSISRQVFKCLGRGQNCAGFCVLHKSMGWFPQEKIKDRMRKIFCKDPPSRPCSGKANTEHEGCLCPRAESDTHSCGLAFHWGCPPAVLSWSVPRKGGQKEPGLLLCSVNGKLLWSLSYAFLKKNWHSLHETLHPDMVTDATVCKDLRSSVPAVTPRWCSYTSQAVQWGCDPWAIRRASSKDSVGICGQRLLRQPRCAAQRQMGFHRQRFMIYWKAPGWMAAFSFPTNLIMGEQNWSWTYLGNGLVAVFFYVSFAVESSMLVENMHLISWENKSNTNRMQQQWKTLIPPMLLMASFPSVCSYWVDYSP